MTKEQEEQLHGVFTMEKTGAQRVVVIHEIRTEEV